MDTLAITDVTDRDATDLTPVGVLQRRWELQQLVDLYHRRMPKRVLEVGTYHGGTLAHWAAAGWYPEIVSIDTFTADDPRARFPHVRFLQGDSRDPAMVRAARRFGPFDFIFIDGGHSEQEAQDDWNAYHQLAAPGGVIALHDILPGRGAQSWIQVEPVWRRIQRQGYVTQEIVASVDVDWGGIGVVYLP